MVDIPEPTPAERKLIAAAAKGEFADFRTGDKDRDDPANGANWGSDRTLRAEILCLLATRTVPDWNLHPRGIRLVGAWITGSFDLEGARLATRLILYRCFFDEVVRLQDSEIDFLSLQGSRLPGLDADRMVVKGGVFLHDGFHATGEVRLPGADIGGNLDRGNGRFENVEGDALSADGATVKGDVFLRDGFRATGAVRLPGADIGGDLFCTKGKFENNDGFQLNLERAKIAGGLQWIEVTLAGTGRVNFHLASAGSLYDDAASWPLKGRLILDGFSYESIGGSAPTDWQTRKIWLDRQHYPDGQLPPQPYEQLIKVLRAMGHDGDARHIAMVKQRALRAHGDLTWPARLWNLILGFVVGYGYAPWRAVPIAAAVVALSGLIFWHASDYGAMQPSKEVVYLAKDRLTEAGTYPPADYPPFNALIYSLDVFVPIVDLHQEDYWLPQSHPVFGGFFKIVMWVHIALGWILTTLTVAGFTGLVKKD